MLFDLGIYATYQSTIEGGNAKRKSNVERSKIFEN